MLPTSSICVCLLWRMEPSFFVTSMKDHNVYSAGWLFWDQIPRESAKMFLGQKSESLHD